MELIGDETTRKNKKIEIIEPSEVKQVAFNVIKILESTSMNIEEWMALDKDEYGQEGLREFNKVLHLGRILRLIEGADDLKKATFDEIKSRIKTPLSQDHVSVVISLIPTEDEEDKGSQLNKGASFLPVWHKGEDGESDYFTSFKIWLEYLIDLMEKNDGDKKAVDYLKSIDNWDDFANFHDNIHEAYNEMVFRPKNITPK